jgi:hypothetical protein
MENDFDKIFKDKLEHRQFEMKPEYWEGAEALIEADERSGGWRRLFVWFGVAVMVGIIVFFVWENDTSNELVEKGENTNTTLGNVLTETKENLSVKKKDFKNKVSTEGESNLEYNLSSDLEEKNNAVNVLLEENNSSKVEGQISNNLLSSKVKQPKLSDFNQDEFSKTIPNAKTKTSAGSDFNSANSGMDNNTSTKNNLIEKNPVITFNDTGNKSDNNKNIKETSSKEKEEGIKEKEIMVESIAFNSTVLLPFLEMFLANNNNKIEELDLKPVSSFTLPRDKFAFGIFGGAVGYPLTENSSENRFIGFKTGFLLERNFQLGKAKMALGTEVTYHYRSGNFVATKQNEVARYSFGRSVAQAKLTPKNLHYLEIPLYLKYQKKRMTFETGASFNYLLGVRGTITEADLSGNSGWVPSLGFKNNHVNVLLGFHYRISDNLHFGVRANYTPGGILDKGAILPEGVTVALQESRPFYLTFRVTQYLKFKK